MPNDTWISTLDVNKFVEGIMKKENDKIKEYSAKKLTILTDTGKDMQSKMQIFGQVQSLLSTFQQNIAKLMTACNPVFQVTSSNTSVAKADIVDTSIATAGSHTLHVNTLAQSSSIASKNFVVASDTTALNITNTINLSIGTSNYSVNVGPTDSLQQIAKNINIGAAANNVGVTASVVSTQTGNYQLVISSNLTGTANAVTVTETGTGADEMQIATGSTATVLRAAQNATFTFDNLNFTQSSNTNIPVQGLSLNLLSGGDTTFVVSASNPASNVQSALQAVVDSYNQIDLFIVKA